MAMHPYGSMSTKRHGTGVIQPIGNQDAMAFLRATAWPNPAAIAAGEQWTGAAKPAPPVSEFYWQYPGAQPGTGPVSAHFDPFPRGSKGYPGGPVLHDGRGGFLAPTNVLPSRSVARGAAATPTQQLGYGATTMEDVQDAFMDGLAGALGAATAIAFIAYLGLRAKG